MTLTLISGDFIFSVFQSYLACSWYLRDSLSAHFRCCFVLILFSSQQFSRLTGTILFIALLGASQLFWQGSVRECGAGKANVWFHGSLSPTPQWPLTPVFCLQLPSHLYLALLRCEGWKEMPFPGNCFCPSGTRLVCEGCSSTSPLLLYSLEPRWALNCICHHHPFPSLTTPSYLPYSFQYAQMSQCVDFSGVFVCWANEPLLSNCPMYKFKGRNEFSHSAITLMSLRSPILYRGWPRGSAMSANRTGAWESGWDF